MESKPLSEELTDQDRVLVVFGYLGPLALVSLVASRREFVKWHAKQGLVLSLAAVVLYPLFGFVQFVLDRYLWAVFGAMFRAAIWLALAGAVLLILVGIVRGLEGERFKIPLLGDLADRL